MKISVKALAITTTNGSLLYTDKEACIYSDYKTARKEKGSHSLKIITISYDIKDK